MAKKVLVVARDMVFRAKLRGVIASAAAELSGDEASCDLAVVEIEAANWDARIRKLVARGTPVLAFGSHVRADLLRTARDAGARAVPNSQVESALREMLA
jgi:hypothetical protein